MTTTKPNLAHTTLATLVLFGAVSMGVTSTAEAKKRNGRHHRGVMKYDKNGDGKIGPREKRAAITAKVQRIVAKADKNGDGRIGPFEIKAAPYRMSMMLTKADANQNGFVTRVELRAVIAKRMANPGSKHWGKRHKGKSYKGKAYKGKNGKAYKGKKGKNGKAYKGKNGKAYKGKENKAKNVYWKNQRTKKPVRYVRDHRQPKPIIRDPRAPFLQRYRIAKNYRVKAHAAQ